MRRDEVLHRADARAHADALRPRPLGEERPLVAAGDLLRGRAAQSRSVALLCTSASGRAKRAVCKQWWQTETGAMMMGFLPTNAIRPDRSGKAFGPIEFDVVGPDGTPVPPGKGGLLVIRNPWPHMFAGDLGRSRSATRSTSTQVPGAYTGGRRRDDATTTATSACSAAPTTCSTSPATASRPPTSRARWFRTRRAAKPA